MNKCGTGAIPAHVPAACTLYAVVFLIGRIAGLLGCLQGRNKLFQDRLVGRSHSIHATLSGQALTGSVQVLPHTSPPPVFPVGQGGILTQRLARFCG